MINYTVHTVQRSAAKMTTFLQFKLNHIKSHKMDGQPNSVHSPPGSSHPACINSSQSPPSLSPSITPSAFYSRHLFTNTFLQVFLVPFGLPLPILDSDLTKWALTFVCISYFSLRFCFWLRVLD